MSPSKIAKRGSSISDIGEAVIAVRVLYLLLASVIEMKI